MIEKDQPQREAAEKIEPQVAVGRPAARPRELLR